MSTKPAEAAAAPPKGKMLLLVGLLVLALVLAGFGGFVYVSRQNAAAALDDEDAQPVAKHAQAGPPSYLPLENMVVNLADPGGEKVAQIGITLELRDAAAAETVKGYLPTIRSGVLLLISQKTSEELLQREGKEKLANDILREAARPFGGLEDDEAEAEAPRKSGGKGKSARKRMRPGDLPVQRVLFSSFIVQ